MIIQVHDNDPSIFIGNQYKQTNKLVMVTCVHDDDSKKRAKSF